MESVIGDWHTIACEKKHKRLIHTGHTALSDRFDPFSIPVISIPFSIVLNALVPEIVCLRKIRAGKAWL